MIAIMSDLFEPLFADAAARDFVAADLLFRAGDPVVSMILLRAGQADLVRHTGHGLRVAACPLGGRRTSALEPGASGAWA